MDLEIITRKPQGKARSTPILFVHGMSFAAWGFEEYFAPYFNAQGFETHSVSLRYHGGSGDNAKVRWVPISAYVKDVKQAINEIGQPPILVGHSMGGLLSQIVARDQEVAALVTLASVPPVGFLPTILRLTRKHPLLMLKCNLTANLRPFLKNPAVTPDMFFAGGMPESEKIRFYDMLCDESFRSFIDMLFPRSGIGKHGKPVLVMGAQGDPAVSANMVRATAKKHGVEAVIYPDAGHCLMLDANWKKYAGHLLKWLEGNGF